MSRKKFERKRERLTKHIAKLEEEYDIVSDQMHQALDDSHHLKLERKRSGLENKLDGLYDELEEIEKFLAKKAYVEFPVGHRIKFGLSDRGENSDFRMGKSCKPGEVAIRLDSVWGVRNKDRGIMQTCGLVGPVRVGKLCT